MAPSVTSAEVQQLLTDAGDASRVDNLRQNLEMIATREQVSVSALLLHIKNDEHESVLHKAAETGSMDTIHYLFDTGIFTNTPGDRDLLLQAKTKRGETALMWAAREDQVDMVLTLYLHGASIATTNVLGETTTMIATSSNSWRALGSVIDLLEGEDSENEVAVRQYIHQAKTNGETPLHMAVRNGNLEIATLLVQHGANVNTSSISGMTPLHIAADQTDVEMARFLVARGSALGMRNAGGLTPLGVAASKLFAAGGSGGVLYEFYQVLRTQHGNPQDGHHKDGGHGGEAGHN